MKFFGVFMLNQTSTTPTSSSTGTAIVSSMMTNALRKPIRLDGETDEEYDHRCSRWTERLEEINFYRKKYRETKNYAWFLEMRRVMPQGYIYRITFDCNYEVLLNMYRQREFHKLPGWQELCRWMETLPYFKEFVDAMKHKKDA